MSLRLRSVCVFCGSSAGRDPAFAEAARAMGARIAAEGRTLVYGGGRVGLMGVLADAALAGGAQVIGVIPEVLMAREVAHTGLSELRVVPTMHARKALMADLSDAFVALPGGYGTLEELFEVVTWAQLGIHAKPIGLLDVQGFFEPLAAFTERALAETFVSPRQRDLLILETTPERLLERLEGASPLAPDPRREPFIR